MRSWLTFSMLVFALAMPMAAASAPISRTLQFDSDPDDGGGNFDPTGASGWDGLRAPNGVYVDGVPFYLEICHGNFECDSLGLSLTWTVGPLTSFEPDPDPDAPEGAGVYSYGSGTLTLDGYWDSHYEPGIFVGDIWSLDIVLTHECSYGLCGTTRATLVTACSTSRWPTFSASRPSRTAARTASTPTAPFFPEVTAMAWETTTAPASKSTRSCPSLPRLW